MTDGIWWILEGALVLGIFFGTWVWARAKDFYSIVDGIWALSFPALSLAGAFYFGGAPSLWSPGIWLALLMSGFWGIRLGTYLIRRLLAHFPHEDTRYVALKVEYGAQIPLRFLRFYLFQAVSVVLLFLGYRVLLSYTGEARPAESLLPGVVLFFVGWAGTSLSDYQASQFRNRPENRGKVCEEGLWAYSRHPNYFFESLTWLGVALSAYLATGSFLGFIPWAIITYLLLFVTGIPYTEAASLKSRGEAFRDYQKRVSPFIPWFRKARS
jgi:steroid 5-alpha reductase family enzyme